MGPHLPFLPVSGFAGALPAAVISESEVFISELNHMHVTIKRKTYSGIEEYPLPKEKIGPLESDCLKHYDKKIADLVCLFLDEESAVQGITTPEKLFELERTRNFANGKALYDYTATLENGTRLTTAQIQKIFHYIWKNYLFGESTGMNFRMIQFFREIQKTEDPDELLFWSFRFCAWGEYDNLLPYTLYRCIVDGRFVRFYNRYPEWQKNFLCMDDTEKSGKEI